jgi:hypothetical protein
MNLSHPNRATETLYGDAIGTGISDSSVEAEGALIEAAENLERWITTINWVVAHNGRSMEPIKHFNADIYNAINCFKTVEMWAWKWRRREHENENHKLEAWKRVESKMIGQIEGGKLRLEAVEHLVAQLYSLRGSVTGNAQGSGVNRVIGRAVALAFQNITLNVMNIERAVGSKFLEQRIVVSKLQDHTDVRDTWLEIWEFQYAASVTRRAVQ